MMTSLNESTVRIEVLGEELRRLREAAGLTLSQVVDRIGISPSHLSKIEMGRRPGKVEDVASLLTLYRVRGEERLELLALTKKSGQPGLWQRYGTYEHRFATLKVLESRATALVNFEALIIPGLLQTVPYARALLTEVTLLEDEDVIGERVATRLARQAILRRMGSPMLVGIVMEAALRVMVGGREVMRDQLRYLAEAAERNNVAVRVVPTSAGGHPGLNGNFLHMGFADRHSVVFVENRTCSLFLEDRSEVSTYDRVIKELLAVAMTEEDSVRLLTEMAASLEYQ